MKIKVKDLEANPFRDLKRYKYDPVKLLSLKASISETSFWDNILVRRHPTKKDKYQIAYGHHRREVLRILKIVEVDLPVRELDDATMLKIMANENMDDWSQSPAIINETVKQTKMFLQRVVADTECLGRVGKSTQPTWTDDIAFQDTKTKGVIGWSLILRFLGKGWKEWQVKQAIQTLQGKTVKDYDSAGKEIKRSVEYDREAVESMGTTEKAAQFKRAVDDYKIPKAKQKEIAKKVNKPGIGSRDVRRAVGKAVVKDRTKPKSKAADLSAQFADIESKANQLSRAIMDFIIEMEKLDVQELKGLQTIFVKHAFSKCLNRMKKMYKLFGYDITKS